MVATWRLHICKTRTFFQCAKKWTRYLFIKFASWGSWLGLGSVSASWGSVGVRIWVSVVVRQCAESLPPHKSISHAFWSGIFRHRSTTQLFYPNSCHIFITGHKLTLWFSIVGFGGSRFSWVQTWSMIREGLAMTTLAQSHLMPVVDRVMRQFGVGGFSVHIQLTVGQVFKMLKLNL